MITEKDRMAAYKALKAWFVSQELNRRDACIVCLDFAWNTILQACKGDREKIADAGASLITDLMHTITASMDDCK